MDADGWIRTGDVGYFDADGFLYLVDRRKEILKYFGSQVSPSELENVLMQHPGIANVCVVGVSDTLAGDLPAAVVIKSTTADVTEDDINTLMKSKYSFSSFYLSTIPLLRDKQVNTLVRKNLVISF